MKDMKEHLEKLQVQIAECELIRDLATDPAKRQLFTSLTEHFKVLASEIQRTMDATMPDTFLGRKTQEPFPNEQDL